MQKSDAPPGVPAQPQPRGERQPIAVRVLTFPRPTDLPGKTGATSVTASDQKNQGRHALEFLPWLRMYRVTYTPPSGAPTVKLIPETWASYEPAPIEG